MPATARSQVSGPGSVGPKVFSASAAPTVNNDLSDGALVGDLWLIPGTAANAVQKLNFSDVGSAGSGTFTLTCEGVTTGAITYSATAATLVGNINTALNSAFGTSQIVATGTLITAISITFSGAFFTNRPVGVITAGVGSLVTATLAITNVTSGVAGAAYFHCSNNGSGAAVWDSLSIGRGASVAIADITDTTGGTAAASVAAITAPGANATTSLTADMTAVKNGLATVLKQLNTINGALKAAGLSS